MAAFTCINMNMSNIKRSTLLFRVWPFPVPNMFRINPVIESLRLPRKLLIVQLLSHAGCRVPERLNQINGSYGETVSIGLIAHSQLKWCVNVALFFVPSHMQVMLTRSFVRKSVDEPGVGVEVEYDGLVSGEDRLPSLVGHSVGMVDGGNQSE